MTQWGLSVQQTLPCNAVGTVSYVGSKGTHLLSLSYVNVINPLTGQPVSIRNSRPTSTGAATIANSTYEGLGFTLQRAFRKGLLFSTNYTCSHEIDDGSMGSGDGDSLAPQIVACRACDNASGIWDVRHAFNANAVYELPFGSGKAFLNQPGILRSVFGSWQLTSIVGAHTGFPVNITATRSAKSVPDGNTNNQRPNIVPGVSLDSRGRRDALKLDQPCGLCDARRRRVRQCATRCGPGPRSVANRSGLEQTNSPARTLSASIPGRSVQHFQSRPIRSARREFFRRTGRVWPHHPTGQHHAHRYRNAPADPVGSSTRVLDELFRGGPYRQSTSIPLLPPAPPRPMRLAAKIDPTWCLLAEVSVLVRLSSEGRGFRGCGKNHLAVILRSYHGPPTHPGE